jgi:hypothetical protein
MLKAIEAVFDGKTFVPTGPVDLPAGTKVTVEVPQDAPGVSAGPPPPPMTEEQKRDWERLSQLWTTTTLPWATAEEAIAAARGRPRPEPPGDAP